MNFFNKIINELLDVDVKIDEKNKALILLSSLPESYNHIIITILCKKETLILEEDAATLLSSEMRERPNQDKHEGLDLVVMGRKERRGKKSSGLSKACHFYHPKGH